MLLREQEQNMIPDKNMGGQNGVTCRMIISTDLGNSSHYDVYDESISASIWVEERPNLAQNFYFILPNTTFTNNSGIKKAVMIKLSHGIAISWNGKLIRHCTSVTTIGENNHVYGNFFGATKK
jgi:hypothetical protein